VQTAVLRILEIERRSETRMLLAHAVVCADCDLCWRLGRELSAGAEPAPAPPIPIRRAARRWAVAGAIAAAAAVLVVPILWRVEARLPDGRRLSSRAFSARVE
jgi:hypothetical protein